ncbi:MAG: DJ-1/PfpI family protein [Ktedonobacteraceae bacterium]|nr:DJ-1/PfpI family protein [Ktedonobacteraceae bacterium]
MSRNVAILIFDEVEVLDFCGPFEVFAVTGERKRRSGEGEAPFSVYTVAEKAGPVLTRNGLSVNPTWTLENCPQPDILLIPGGYGTRGQIKNEKLLQWIREQAERVELLLSVCTGSLLLAKAGLLEGLSATTHYLAMDELRALAPDTQICPTERYVDNGKIITSAGISAGIDMSLYVVARLLGSEQAAETAQYMQYDYWKGTETPVASSVS